MRFMMFIYPGLQSEADWEPSAEAVAAMTKYNEQLRKEGVLLSLDGLRPPSEGARLTFASGEPVVTDGPFAETKEVIGGFWMIETKSKQDAIEIASRCPVGGDVVIELRRVQELSDFPEDVRATLESSEESAQ